MHKIGFYIPFGAVPKVMSATLNLVVSTSSTTVMQGQPRLANVFDRLFLPSRIFVIIQFFYKINFMFNFQKTRIFGYLDIFNFSNIYLMVSKSHLA